MNIINKIKKFVVNCLFWREEIRDTELVGYVYFYVSCNEKDILLNYGYKPFHIIDLPNSCIMIFVVNFEDVELIADELEAKRVQFYIKE